MEAISDRVAAIIKESGLTQSKFAARLHIGQSQISAFCSGARAPTDRVIADICREFGVDERWLQTGEGEMKRKAPDMEALAAEIVELPQDADARFKRYLISEMLRLPPETWAQIEALRSRIAAADKGKEETGQ